MKLLVIGSGMMGSAAAYDMARQGHVDSVTLADNDLKRAKEAAARVNRIAGNKKVRAVALDAAKEKEAASLMKGHDGALSAVPYFLNLGLAKAAIRAGCHFADLGGKLVRRLGGRADALKLYVGGLPEKPMSPFHYQVVFSVEGLINEFVEPARILRHGKITTIEPLVAFQTSGGTSTLPETFAGKVGECFEKTLRYPDHYDLLCGLKELGLFSNEKMLIGDVEVAPRALLAKVFEDKFASDGPDVCIMRLEAHESVKAPGVRGLLGGKLKGRVATFTMVDRYDPKSDMSSMMRTTAFPASIVLQMMCGGAVSKRGAVLQERDIPADSFLKEIARRGIKIEYRVE